MPASFPPPPPFWPAYPPSHPPTPAVLNPPAAQKKKPTQPVISFPVSFPFFPARIWLTNPPLHPPPRPETIGPAKISQTPRSRPFVGFAAAPKNPTWGRLWAMSKDFVSKAVPIFTIDEVVKQAPIHHQDKGAGKGRKSNSAAPKFTLARVTANGIIQPGDTDAGSVCFGSGKSGCLAGKSLYTPSTATDSIPFTSGPSARGVLLG
ncbi:hypothetical protein PTTG_05683 [Puccinia triticina 1-1 BBBD Race 1]|uniref:Uncharacterized protein n=1 Tax=Puccinia triticina (isolate 1-1 / race 1 (BBBD)) TaxID=630390 RepID=A0A0C4EXY4_PUCT1|nr:hypothetical protein PTTG_05683 [Puccinia triticina 1-1 BBBD Race 1]